MTAAEKGTIAGAAAAGNKTAQNAMAGMNNPNNKKTTTTSTDRSGGQIAGIGSYEQAQRDARTAYAEEEERRAREAKAAAEEKKRQAEQERKDFLQKIYDDIAGSIDAADAATNKSALNIASSNPNTFSSVGRGQSAQYSNADDSTKAIEYINENLNQNRNTAYQNAVNAGIEKLKGRQETTLAEYLKQAGDLQIDAQNQANMQNVLTTTLAGLTDALKYGGK